MIGNIPTIVIVVAIGALMIVSIIELGFIVATVDFLHSSFVSGSILIRHDGQEFPMKVHPHILLVDQGHTSNGAAGTAFVLIGLLGFIVLFLRSRPGLLPKRLNTFVYNMWLALNVLALMLTLGALVYTFVLTFSRRGQSIDVVTAQRTSGERYPEHSWTPQNWFKQLLKLDIVNDGDRSKIEKYLRIMRGWQYNLVPFVAIQLVETILVVADGLMRRRSAKRAIGSQQEKSRFDVER